jgi:hypothetical protein
MPLFLADIHLIIHLTNIYQIQQLYKLAGGVAQVVEGLPSKHEVLSSNSSTTKKKKLPKAKRDRGAA